MKHIYTHCIHGIYRGLDMISMQNFLEREIMSGRIVSKATGQAIFPPGNRTNWRSASPESVEELNKWSRTIGFTSPWNFDQCMVGFTAKPSDVDGDGQLDGMVQKAARSGAYRTCPLTSPLRLLHLRTSAFLSPWHTAGNCVCTTALFKRNVLFT